MKWIGKHIVDFIARFRSDVYLDSVPTGIIIGGGNLGLDVNNKIVRSTVTGSGGGGDENLDEAFDVSNQDPGFAHVLGDQYTTATSYTAVLKALLSPYNRTTIALDKIGFQKESSDGVYATEAFLTGASTTVEVGQAFKITKIQYTVADDSQTTDTSVDFREGLSNIQTGFTDSTTSLQALTSDEVYANESVSSTSGDSYQFNVRATDDGGSGLSDQQITSSYKTFYSYHRLKIGAYGNASNSGFDTLADAAQAKTLFDNMTIAKNSLQGRSNATAYANTAMNDETKYTWIMYPSLWGSLSNVYLLPGTPLGIGGDGAWVDKQTFTFANNYGHNVEYYAYRSSVTGAYNNSTNQQIQLIF